MLQNSNLKCAHSLPRHHNLRTCDMYSTACAAHSSESTVTWAVLCDTISKLAQSSVYASFSAFKNAFGQHT